jgi:DNA polymerase elongation subunit (family B)
VPKGYAVAYEDLRVLARRIQGKLAKNAGAVIHDITTVTKTSFYGYHEQPSQFLRISYYDMNISTELMRLLSSGEAGAKLQPYEAHIDLFQHFYAEFNLSGMDFITVSNWTYRKPVRLGSLPAPTNALQKESPSGIEADCFYFNIVKCPFDRLEGFENVEIPSIVQIWREQIEESKKRGEVFTSRLSELPVTQVFPHDFMQEATVAVQFQYLSALADPSKDTLAMEPSTRPIGQQIVNEDDEKFIDDLLDISKPKALAVRSRPQTPNISTYLHTPKQLFSTDQRMESDQVRAFYHSDYNRSSASLPKPDCAYPLLHLSTYTREVARGITNKQLLDLALTQSQQTTPGGHPYQISPCTDKSAKRIAAIPPGMKRDRGYLTYFYMEIYPQTRADLRPDPLIDRVHSVLYQTIDDYGVDREGVIAIRSLTHTPGTIWGEYRHNVEWVETENELFHAFCTIWQRADPDIIISFDTAKESLGYLLARSQTLKLDLSSSLTRRRDSTLRFDNKKNKAARKIHGRIVIDAWRMIKTEIKLQMHSFSNMAYHILGLRVPVYSWSTLRTWLLSMSKYAQGLDYFRKKVELTRAMVEHFGFIDRACQLARIYGVDLLSVFTRGSQFRVESIMKRYCLYNTDFLLLSATKAQVKSQKDLESIPLVMEPPKAFSDDPVLVLDFQSLYPSIMIAYNLCYTTCLGKLRDEAYKQFGVTYMKGEMFAGLQPEDVHVTPNHVAYLRPHKRVGVIPRLMHVLLQTRIMVKQAMKKTKSGSVAHSQLMHQQMGIKMLCNTTYGYTGAGHTGRMPCGDLADSIVALARRTLEAARTLVEEREDWNAEVIYGDTDSLMIKLPGRTVAQAFTLGREIAQTINSHNPPPIEILLEKVYCPFISITKKHYSGLKYESPTSEPYLESKGLEAIRRDSCQAASIMQEKVLNLLFRTKDLYQVYHYLSRQWNKITSGQVRLRDFIIYKKVMMGSYKVLPHAAIVTERNIEKDRMATPHFGERVGYVVASAPPGAAVKESVVSPEEFMSKGLSLHYEYYINNQILPVLGRVLEPVHVKVGIWYESFPRKYMQQLPAPGQGRMDQIFSSNRCLVCGELGNSNPCEVCHDNTRYLSFHIFAYLSEAERQCRELSDVCRACAQLTVGEVECCAIECPVFYQKSVLSRSMAANGPKLSREVQVEPMLSAYIL